jgi:hypothetical protein
MKKLVIFILLSIITFPGYAEHHRGHALSYLEQIQFKVDIVRDFSVNFAQNTTPTTHGHQLILDADGNASGVFIGNMNGIEQRVQQTIETLNGNFSPMCYQLGFTPDEDLQCARRLINQPNNHIGIRSALQFATTAMYGISVFTLWDEDCHPQYCGHTLNILTNQLNMIWSDMQQAQWHINDAILEEVEE